jgi:hypothetical protein
MTENENMGDDLEKMITEAELEAQIEENKAEETSSSFDAEPVEGVEEPAPEKKKLSKARLIYRRILVWLVVIALAFAGGFFLDTILRFQPEKNLVEDLRVDLDKSAAEIISLEDDIERLNLFKDQNTALVEEINQVTIHITLLSARAAVADARLALEQDRKADTKLALDKLGSTLEMLTTLVNEDQAEVVETMIQRQKLIVLELDEDSFSAQSDLEVLAARLTALENNLFASP